MFFDKRPGPRGYALPYLSALLSAISLMLVFGGRGVLPHAVAARAGASTHAAFATGSVLYLPAGAHAAGANGANWRTDVEVHNPGSSTASFTVQLLQSGADNSSPQSQAYTLAAGRSRRFSDVLVSEFGFVGAAALRVSVTSGALVMTSRTYNLVGANPWNLPTGASFGLFEAGIAESDALSYGQEGRLIQLTQQTASSLDGFRTNVGFVNTTASPIDVRADFYRSDGTYLGSKSGSDTNLPAYGFRQLNEVLGTWGTVADGYAVVKTTTPGGGLIAFATVIDNHYSGDPIFIPAAKVGGASASPTPTPTPTPPSAAKPNLYLYKPSGWTSCLSADSQTGCCTNTSCCSPFLLTSSSAFLQMFVANNGQATLSGPVRFALSIDGVLGGYANWANPSGLEPGFGVVITWEYKNPIAAGTHTLTLTLDPDNTIAETNEGDNSCASSATWISVMYEHGEKELGAPAGEDRVSEADPVSVREGPGLLTVEPRSARTAGPTEPIYVPASAHASGLNGSNWRTDLEVHNPGATGVTFTIALLKQSTDNGGSVPTQTFSLGPQQSVRYVDVLSTVFSTDGAAALRVTSQSGALVVNSRTYNLVGTNSVGLPVGASFGQFVPGLAESAAVGPGEEGRIIQLTHRDAATLVDFRSNVGFVNTTASPIDLRIDLIRADGTVLATIQDDRTHLRPYESKQINGVFGTCTSWLDDGHVVVRSTTAGGRFFAFATVIDNHLTGDPIFVPAVKMSESALPPTPTPTPTPTPPGPTPTPTPTPGAISVTINPGAVTIQPGGRQTFHAAVMGTTNTGVTWKIEEGTAGGTVDGQGSYTAPATSGIYHVVATSQADSTKSGSAYVMVSTMVPDAEYAPKPTVTGTTTTETKSLTTTPNVKGTLTLSDGTKVEISPLPSAITVTLTRSTNTLDAVRAAGQETSGAMRTVTFTGDSASLDFVPTITIPAAEAGSLSALNVARVGPVAQGGQVQDDKVMFLPVARDVSGNMVVRDIYLRGAARGAAASVAAPSAGRTALGVMKTIRSIWTASTYQGKINWAVEPQLVRMIPTSEAPKRKPLSTLPQSQQDEILRKPIQNVIVLAHGHNEAERYGYETAEVGAPWLMKYKQDVWTALYQEFQTNDAAYAGCTAFYEYIYPSYRPIFDGPGERLGASLERLITADPQLKKLTNKYNLFFVAHSMGGLVARSAINQLSSTVSPNFEKLVTWGTPHHGSPVVTMRYLLTSGYNLEVPNMCAQNWPPLETFNQFSLYHGFAKDNAIDTPGERDLRWDNSKPLNLDGIGWKRAVWQEGDDVAFDPARNTYLYNSKLLDFNRTDKYALSDKYVALYGITSKIAPIDLTDCPALVTFAFSAPIAQGNGITHWLYNNPATVGSSYPGNPAVKESDGAVSVDSMVGLGVFSPFNTRSLEDTDHEQYYGDEGDKTASFTLDLLKLKTDPTKKCDCPTLVVDKVESAGSASNIFATLTWPGDTKPGQRVKGIASARELGASRVVTPARSFTAPDNGKLTAVFDTSTLTPASKAENIFLLAQFKDGSELSVPATPAPLFKQAGISFTAAGTFRNATGAESPGTFTIDNNHYSTTSACIGTFTGSTFSCTWSGSEPNCTGRMTLVFNSKYDTVQTFAYDQVSTWTDGSSRTEGLTGGNIPMVSDGWFSVSGSDACSNVTRATLSETSAGSGSNTLVSYSCTTVYGASLIISMYR